MKMVDKKILCDKCDAEMTRGNGWFECPDCGYRTYGNADPNFNPNTACINCGRVHLVSLRQCPNCGLSRES